MIHYIKIFLFIRLNKGLCYCIDTFRSVHLPFASVINVINNVWMMLLTAFISPKLSPVPFITKLLAVKNRPEAKAIIHPIILRPNLSKLLIRIINHHILSARNLIINTCIHTLMIALTLLVFHIHFFFAFYLKTIHACEIFSRSNVKYNL